MKTITEMRPTTKDCEYNVVGTTPPDLGFGKRHIQAVLLFFSVAITEASGVAFTLGVVAMTDMYNTNAEVEIFNWDKKTQDIIVSSLLWGYMLMQFPAGRLSHAYGGKTVIVLATFFSGFATTLVPWAGHIGGWQGMCVCRVIQGLAQGATMPSIHTNLGKWAPVNERSRLGAYVYGGSQIGTAISMLISGYLASTSVGWPSIFYVLGLISVLYAAILQLFMADSPAKHQSISIEEKLYIQTSLGQVDIKESMRIPWRSILKCPPVWATVLAHIGSFWCIATYVTEAPSYIHKILGANIQENGLISCVPYFIMWVTAIIFSFISDIVVNKQYCSITTARKVANTIGTWCPALGFVVLSYVPRQEMGWAIFNLIFIISSCSGTFVGYCLNLIDLAPNFAGTLMSLSCFFSSLIITMAPITAGLILTDDTDILLWRQVFFIAAGILFVTNLFYLIFGSAEIMPWNEPEYFKRNKNHSESQNDPEIQQITTST